MYYYYCTYAQYCTIQNSLLLGRWGILFIKISYKLQSFKLGTFYDWSVDISVVEVLGEERWH